MQLRNQVAEENLQPRNRSAFRPGLVEATTLQGEGSEVRSRPSCSVALERIGDGAREIHSDHCKHGEG